VRVISVLVFREKVQQNINLSLDIPAFLMRKNVFDLQFASFVCAHICLRGIPSASCPAWRVPILKLVRQATLHSPRLSSLLFQCVCDSSVGESSVGRRECRSVLLNFLGSWISLSCEADIPDLIPITVADLNKKTPLPTEGSHFGVLPIILFMALI